MSRKGTPQGLPPIARLMMLVEVDQSAGCWLFIGSLNSGGYAHISTPEKRTVRAHRFTYEHFVGPIPDGKVLDHTCRVRHCVNPYHLEPVTQQENVRRGELWLGGSCGKGHTLEGDNLYTYITKRGYTTRACRICRSAIDRAARTRRLARLKEAS